MDADLITKVACHMIAKYQTEAARHAELRAMDLRQREPGASARWHLVAHAIGILYEDAKAEVLDGGPLGAVAA